VNGFVWRALRVRRSTLEELVLNPTGVPSLYMNEATDKTDLKSGFLSVLSVAN